jgi:cytoskeleton protein RodZ
VQGESVGTLDTVQQEQLKAIGTYLSQIRQEQERSLEDIAAKTYIPLRLLKALEAGQERPLPEPVFIQGFIRRYGDALGLDGMDLSQRFPVHVTPLPMSPAPTPSRDRYPLRDAYEPSYGNAQGNVQGNVQVEEQAFSTGPRLPRRSVSWMPYLAAAAILALVGILLGIVKGISSRQPVTSDATVVLPKQPSPSPTVSSSSPGTAASGTAPVGTASPGTASPSSSAPTPSAAASPNPTRSSPRPTASSSPTTGLGSTSGTSSSSAKPAAASPVNVAINLTGESWIQVLVDGEVREEGVLPRGTKKTWAGRREITIVAGNAGAVSVTHNDNPAKSMGAAGDVKEMTFKP